MAIFILHVGVIHFLRSFISSLRGDHFIPPWGFENFHVDILDFQPRKRKVPPLELKSSKRGTVFGTRIYYGNNTIRITLCRDARSSVHCVKGYSIVVLTGTDARAVRPYKGLLVSLYYNGRTTVRPYKGLFVSSSHVIGYSSRFDRDGRTDRASLQDSVTASGVRGVR